MHRLHRNLGNRRVLRFFSSDNLARESIFTDEHVELRRSLNKIIEKESNPYVDEWEAACRFPAHDVFKKLGNAGFLGVTKRLGACSPGKFCKPEKKKAWKKKKAETFLQIFCNFNFLNKIWQLYMYIYTSLIIYIIQAYSAIMVPYYYHKSER